MEIIIEHLKSLLGTVEIPCTYGRFPTKEFPQMPYLLYQVLYSNNFSADGSVFKQINHIQIALYTKLKSISLEDKVEKALSSFFWEKTETYLEEQECYQILYEIEV